MVGLVLALRIRKGGLFFAYLAAVLIYFTLVAEGNIDAPYRQLPIIPSVSVFVAFGVQAVVALGISLFSNFRKGFDHKKRSHLIVWGCMIFILINPILKYKEIFSQDYPWHSDSWEMAQEIDNYVDGQTKLVVVGEYSKHVGGYDLSPVLYYYSGLQGWTLTPVDWNVNKVEALKQKGAKLFIVVPPYNDPSAVNYQPEQSPDALIQELKTRYPVLYEDQNRIVLDLR